MARKVMWIIETHHDESSMLESGRECFVSCLLDLGFVSLYVKGKESDNLHLAEEKKSSFRSRSEVDKNDWPTLLISNLVISIVSERRKVVLRGTVHMLEQTRLLLV